MNVIRCTRAQFAEVAPDVGQIYLIQDNDEPAELMMWTGTEWNEVKAEGGSEITMTAYDMNKQIIGQLPELNEETIEEKKTLIFDFCEETRNSFYMLLCKDIGYFTLCQRTLRPTDAHTVMHYIDTDTLISIDDLVVECVKNVGTIKSIEPVDGAIEIWITNPYGETHAMYFFPYDRGVEACQ